MAGVVPSPGETSLARIVRSIRDLYEGRSNAVGTLTLAAGTTTTTVQFINCSISSKVFLSPTTANAATAVGTTYVSSKGAGSFTLTHANNAQTDRTFDYVCIG